MGLSKVLVGVTGAVIAISGVTVVAMRGGGDDAPANRPAASVSSNVNGGAAAPEASGSDQAGSVASSAASPSSVPPAAQATTPAPAAPGAAPVPSVQQVIDSVSSLMNQVQQQANAGGQPQQLTKEQVDALLHDQLAKLGIKL